LEVGEGKVRKKVSRYLVGGGEDGRRNGGRIKAKDQYPY